MASSGLKKMLIFIIFFRPEGVIVLVCNTMTPLQCWKIIKINIFIRPEEAMLGTGESLSYL